VQQPTSETCIRLPLAYGEILATIEGPETLAVSTEPQEREHGSAFPFNPNKAADYVWMKILRLSIETGSSRR
jgi:hypothetical protein